ncbi:hypothetical protein RI138_14710 [Streptomyces sp. C11-1]|uniref:Uncharacterized protein n=1 Tax=Streptomyces durocortorensis TaxID=2811104 RepID=A0ABY9W1T5_9ACTN|nr:hypothetical protein [Streptomyces durocortorensis]WNF27977.1 hypothetical protein RI138_14710 [Streptomyces durocortorensis]
MRTIEVVVDRDAVVSGVAAAGEPWQHQDLGHDYGGYAFFEQCQHRMVCTRFGFCTPRESTRTGRADDGPASAARRRPAGRDGLRTALVPECAQVRESDTVTAVTLVNMLVDFARTGRIGPLHRGMPLAEAEDLLGPGRPHPAHVMKGPDIDGYPYSWGWLKLDVTKRSVSGIRFHRWPVRQQTCPFSSCPNQGRPRPLCSARN